MNLSEMVDRFAEDTPDHPALVFEETQITYAELLKSINAMSNAFVKAGVSKGDRVAIIMGNRPELVVSYFAAGRIGAIAVPLNPLSTVYELTHYFTECKPMVVVCAAEQLPKIDALRERWDFKLVVSTVSGEGAVPFAEIMRDYAGDRKALDLSPDDPAVIIFTAGLLGRSLGATLSHNNLYSNAHMLEVGCDGNKEDRGLALIPLFHAFGATVNLIGTFRVGGTVYLVEKVDFPKLIPWLQKARITYTGLVPMVYFGLLYHPSCKGLDLSSWRIAIAGGAKLAVEIYEKFKERYNVDICHGYGLTEASPVVSWNSIKIPNKPATVGRAINDVMIGIHDDNGNPVPPHTEGEVVVKGPNVMLGYLGRPKETETVIRNGWLYTGDLGYLDEEGYLKLTGLKKDLIITSGFNVYCQEVEEIMIRHPKVADVALIGIDDLMRGQVIEALVVPEPGPAPEEREIIRSCREYLSKYKCPRKVTFVKEIVRDAHGKPSSWS